MSRLITVISRLHRANLKTAIRLLPALPLEPWPDPTPISIRRLKIFDHFDIRPTQDQLRRAARSYLRYEMAPIIIDDENQVLLGQLRAEAIRERFGSLSRVDSLRFSQLTEKNVLSLVHEMIALFYRDDGWDLQMVSIDCQGLCAVVPKPCATARTGARLGHDRARLAAR